MTTPLVSIVIPAYNQAEFTGEAIQSVLNQTYSNFELLVVNDASPDNTYEVVNQFNDSRIRQIVHPENLGLPASRNSGMRASRGEFIALLDADDFFHPNKLEAHVGFLAANPEVGVSYNNRFELNHSSKTIREMWIPPIYVGLEDVILGFPFSPSDMVIRQTWIASAGLFDESFICGGEDTDYPCRLALAGCKFRGLNNALNYRRYVSGRQRKNLSCRFEDVNRALEATFNDSRCPEEALFLRPTALKHHLMVLVSLALIQGETELGQEFIRRLVIMDPLVSSGVPCELIDFLLMEVIADENIDHEETLRVAFAQLPQELAHLHNQIDWAKAAGYLNKGIRNIIWGRTDTGKSQLQKAIQLGATWDERSHQRLIHQLLGFENEFGRQITEEIIDELVPFIGSLRNRKSARRVVGSYSLNLAFRDYFSHDYQPVPAEVTRALINDPTFIANRGVLSIFFRSLLSKKTRSNPKNHM